MGQIYTVRIYRNHGGSGGGHRGWLGTINRAAQGKSILQGVGIRQISIAQIYRDQSQTRGRNRRPARYYRGGGIREIYTTGGQHKANLYCSDLSESWR